MTFKEFSAEILTTGDIDPDYIFIREECARRGWGKPEMWEWIKLKLVVYDSVSELAILDGKADLSNCKYGSERRKHKRNALTHYRALNAYFQPIEERGCIQGFFEGKGQKVFNSIKSIYGFGSWAAWKCLDLMDCCYGADVDFNGVNMAKSYLYPLKGLLMLHGYPESLKWFKTEPYLYLRLLTETYKLLKPLKGLPTPHNGNRGIRINEVETLLCKFHSYKHGHYQPGQDLNHLNHRRKEPS